MIKRWLGLVLCVVCVYAARMQGPVHLKDESYDKLVVRGAARLERVHVGHLIVYGELHADELTGGHVQVDGPVQARGMDVDRLDVSGPLHLDYSSIKEVFALGDVRIRGLKVEKFYLYTQPSLSLYGVQADEVFVQSREPITLTVGDACYVSRVHFTEASGVVAVMKDRSFIGEVEGGVIRR